MSASFSLGATIRAPVARATIRLSGIPNSRTRIGGICPPARLDPPRPVQQQHPGARPAPGPPPPRRPKARRPPPPRPTSSLRSGSSPFSLKPRPAARTPQRCRPAGLRRPAGPRRVPVRHPHRRAARRRTGRHARPVGPAIRAFGVPHCQLVSPPRAIACGWRCLSTVMPGLDPGIHAVQPSLKWGILPRLGPTMNLGSGVRCEYPSGPEARVGATAWMPGSSP